jgi:hypothetical protein
VAPLTYLIKKTSMAIVNKAIVVIKTLWPQRAIFPSILTLPVNLEIVQPGRGRIVIAPYMGARLHTSTPAWVVSKRRNSSKISRF